MPDRELTRRDFLAACAVAGASYRALFANGSYSYVDAPTIPLRVAIIDSGSGVASSTMTSMMRGIDLGSEEAARTAAMFGFKLETRRVDASDLDDALCSSPTSKYAAVIGGGAEEQCVQFGDAARQAGILFIDTARRAHPLSVGKRTTNTFRVAASAHMLATTMAGALTGSPGQRWLLLTEASGGEAIAKLVADRARALNVRLTTEAAGDSESLKTRVAGLLAANDIDVLLIGQPYMDAAGLLSIIEATRSGTEVVILSGATTLAPADLPNRQLLWPAGWHSSLTRFGAEQLNDRFRARYRSEMDGPAWAGWAGMKILVESALRCRSADPMKLRNYLEAPGSRFDGHKGASLSFENHQLKQPLYVLESNGEQAAPRIVAESM